MYVRMRSNLVFLRFVGHVNSDTYNDFVALAHDETHAVHVFVGTGAVGKFAGLTSTLTPPCSEEQEVRDFTIIRGPVRP